MFVTSQGSPYTRFQRALATGNLALVQMAAAELPQVGLRDALEVCLLVRDSDVARYDRAAVRWVGRFALEGRGVSLSAVEQAVAALAVLPERPQEAMERLGGLCAAHGIRS